MALKRSIKKVGKRKKDAHKGDFGRVFVLAGAKGYTGAAYLTSMAAMRSGAGLVTLGVPEKIYPILAKCHAEVMVKSFPSTAVGSFASRGVKPALEFLKTQDVLALGPGLSQNPQTQKFVRQLVGESAERLVLDADALNALSGHLKLFHECAHRTVITPHPGEFKRLFGGRVSSSVSERKKRAADVAKKYGIVVLLKGHKTVVANPNGKVFVNSSGNPGMATGGSGDVLTGLIAALIGQKVPLFEAACMGAYVHGLAGDLAARQTGEISLIAGDILDELPKAIKKTVHI